MKIVHLVTSGDVAGGQLVAFRLADAARERGDDVEFVSPTAGPFLDRVVDAGFPAHLLDVGRTYRVAGAARLARLLRARSADVLHTHVHLAARVLGRFAARAAGVPVVDHLHIENHFRRETEPVLRRLDNATSQLTAALIAVSEDTKRAFVAQGYAPDAIVVIPNGVDVPAAPASRNGSLRRELGVPARAPLAGEIARLADVKGQRDLIRAAASIPELHVVLVGDDLESGGAYRAALEREAEAAGVGDRVVLTGYRADAGSILEELDVYVLPSTIEGMPMTVLEAMARRKPVIATPVGGTPEVVLDGETGVLVPPRDPERLAAALRSLLDDPDRARRLGEAGYERVKAAFDAAACARAVLEVYDDVARR